MDPYQVFLVVLGGTVLGSAVLPRSSTSCRCRYRSCTWPAASSSTCSWTSCRRPTLAKDTITERLSELVVIISPTGAGLKIDRRFGWRTWAQTWRRLAIAMLLTIGATAVPGRGFLGLVPASALLLGAVLAPTRCWHPTCRSGSPLGGLGGRWR